MIECLDFFVFGVFQVIFYVRVLMGEIIMCVIIGGGLVGMVLGLLLVWVGVQVILLEKYGDFLCDFCGDMVYLMMMWLFDEFGLWECFVVLFYSEVCMVILYLNGCVVIYIDFE